MRCSSALVAGMLVLVASQASAAVFNVASGDVAGLVSAITTANLDAAADTINLAAGTYSVTAIDNTGVYGPTGLPIIAADLEIVGAGAGTTTLTRSSGSQFRLVAAVGFGVSLRIAGVTISGGDLPVTGTGTWEEQGGCLLSEGVGLTLDDVTLTGCNAPGAGGALRLAPSDLSILNSTIDSNTAGYSGGVEAPFSRVRIRNSFITNNTGTSGGGGISAYGSLVDVVGSSFSGNSGLNGGAISVRGGLRVLDTTIVGNTATQTAGGVHALFAAVYLRRTTISGNQSVGPAGGVELGYADARIYETTISGNTAGSYGGGIGINTYPGTDGVALRMTNSTISGNTAAENGGGIAAGGITDAAFLNSSIVNNVADSDLNGFGAGGGMNVDDLGVTRVSFRNSVLSGNVGTLGAMEDCFGPIRSVGNNHLDATGSGCVISGTRSGNLVNGASAALGALGAFGGPTQTHLPGMASPLLDTGRLEACPGIDQRGFGRPAGAGCDKGAAESGAAAASLPAHAFLCHDSRKAPGGPSFSPIAVGLADAYHSAVYEASKPEQICYPAEFDGDVVGDPQIKLRGFKVKFASGTPFVPQTSVQVRTRASLVTLDLKKPTRLLVPSSLDTAGPVAAPSNASHGVDHYLCYAVKKTSGTDAQVRGIVAGLGTELTTHSFQGNVYPFAHPYALSSPKELCVPVDQDGQGIKNGATTILCDSTKQVDPSLDPTDVLAIDRYPAHSSFDAHVNNELGAGVDTVKKPERACLPAEIVP